MTPIEQLHAAGFSEKEIADWSAQQQSTLEGAGFAKEEIDKYFGRTAEPEPIPPAFVERLRQGLALNGLFDEIGKAEKETFNQYASTPAISQETETALKDLGIFRDPEKGYGGPIRAFNEALLRPSAAGVQMLMAPVMAGISGVGAAVKGVTSRLGGDETMSESARREAENLLNFTMANSMASGAHAPMTRPERLPSGETIDLPIGGMPKPEDFSNASQAIMGTPVPHPQVTEKLRQVWREGGIHPSEVAYAAEREPTIAQALASSTDKVFDLYKIEKDIDATIPESVKEPATVGDNKTLGTMKGAFTPRPIIPEFISPSETPPEANMVRLYRGERPGNKNNGPWFTTDVRIAHDYGKVSYIDVTQDELRTGFRRPPDYIDPDKNEYVAKDGSNFSSRPRTPIETGWGGKDLFFLPDPNAPPVGMAIGAPKRQLTPAEKSVLSHIDVGGASVKRPFTLDQLYTATVDRLHEIPDYDAMGNVLPTPDNPYRLMRMLSGNPARSRGWLELGQVDYQTGNKIGPSLSEILRPVRNDLDPFRAFVDSLRAIELEGHGVDTGFEPVQIRDVVRAGQAEFAPIAAKLVEYQNNLLKYMRDAGVISDAEYTATTNKHLFYVPFHVVLEERAQRFGGGSMQPSNPLYKMEGSFKKKVDPLEDIVRHTHQYVAMAERNRAATAMIDLLESRGEAELATTATKAANKVHIMELGVETQWEVPEVIADTVKNVDGQTAGFLANWLASDNKVLSTGASLATLPARALRAGATQTFEFMARNFVVDYFTALLQSEKPVFTPWDQMKGFYSAVAKDEYFRRWMQSGGGNAELVAMDRRYGQEDLRGLTRQTDLMSRGINVVRHPLDALRTISELSERSTRLGEFRYVYDREIQRGATPDDAARTAGFASREVTVDFARRGAVTQSLSMIDAFWNAGLQGVDRFARQAKDHPGATALKVAAGITLPSILLWTVNHDDPRYREMQGWERDLFWNIFTDHWVDMGPAASPDADPYAVGGTSWRVRGGRYERNDGWILRLRKPFEAGVLFGSGIERMLDRFFTDNPERLDDYVKSVYNTLVPVPGMTLLTPAIEQFANKSTFTGRTLIPQYLEKQMPEYEYTPYTTETAKALGKIVGAFPGMSATAMSDSPAAGVAHAISSPILMENYLRAWTGGGGMYLLSIADAALRKQGIVPDPPKPDDTLADMPVVRAFVVRYPAASTDSIQHFYDEFAVNQKYFTSWRARAQTGDADAARRIQAAGGQRMFIQLNAMHKTLGEQAKTIRDIWTNPEIEKVEKRQLIDTLYFTQIQVAQQGLQILRQADKALAP